MPSPPDPPASSEASQSIDVDTLLSWMEPSLKTALGPNIVLNLQSSGMAVFMAAGGTEIEAILRRLIEGASLAMPEGGELTVATGWLDHVSGEWAGTRFKSRRYVRLTVADTGPGDYADTSRRVLSTPPASSEPTAADECVASLVGRLSGYVVVECAAKAGSRIHVCVPAVQDARTQVWKKLLE